MVQEQRLLFQSGHEDLPTNDAMFELFLKFSQMVERSQNRAKFVEAVRGGAPVLYKMIDELRAMIRTYFALKASHMESDRIDIVLYINESGDKNPELERRIRDINSAMAALTQVLDIYNQQLDLMKITMAKLVTMLDQQMPNQNINVTKEAAQQMLYAREIQLAWYRYRTADK